MITRLPALSADHVGCRLKGAISAPRRRWLAVWLLVLPGCGPDAAPATVEGTLRCQGNPLNHCLVTFLPETGQGAGLRHSTGLTDAQGVFRLRFDDQQAGASVGWHRVTVQDLSVSTGVRRRDHGAVDTELDDSAPPPDARPSRVPDSYTAVTSTPLRKEVRPGRQVIDLEIP